MPGTSAKGKRTPGKRPDDLRYARGTRTQKRLIPATTRSNHFGGGTYLSNATYTSATYKTKHPLLPGVRFTRIQVAFGNYTLIQGPNDITVSAYIIFNGFGYRLTWNGAKSITIPRGAMVPLSDPLPIVLDYSVSDYLWCVTYVAGARWPVSLQLAGSVGEGITYSTDLSQCDGLYVSSGNLPAQPAGATTGLWAYSPVAILGVPDRPYPALGIIGDSIAVGAGEVPFSSPTGTIDDYGFVRRYLNGLVGEAWFAKFGDTAYNLSISAGFRAHALEWSTSILDETGVNDFFLDSRSTAGVAGARIANAWQGAIRDSPVYWTTVTPRTNTTDAWASIGNQSAYNTANEASRVAFNDWVRAGAPINATTKAYVALVAGAAPAGSLLIGQPGHPVSGYYELADTVESARNSGRWRAPDGKVTDGVMSSSTNTNQLTSASAPFTSAMVGLPITVAGAGGSGADLNSKITGYTSPTQVTLYDIARTTVAAAVVAINPWTFDGVHPTNRGHAALAAGLGDGRLLAV